MAPSLSTSDHVAYYDDAYGPFYNGYWIEQNEYFFASGPNHPYVRDDRRHFRRVMITGYHPVEGFGPELARERIGAR